MRVRPRAIQHPLVEHAVGTAAESIDSIYSGSSCRKGRNPGLRRRWEKYYPWVGREREGGGGGSNGKRDPFHRAGAVTLRTIIELFASPGYEMVSPLIVADQFIPLLGWGTIDTNRDDANATEEDDV